MRVKRNLLVHKFQLVLLWETREQIVGWSTEAHRWGPIFLFHDRDTKIYELVWDIGIKLYSIKYS